MSLSITLFLVPHPEIWERKGWATGGHPEGQAEAESWVGCAWVPAGDASAWWGRAPFPLPLLPLVQLSASVAFSSDSLLSFLSWLAKNGPEMDLLTIQLPTLSCSVAVKRSWPSLALRLLGSKLTSPVSLSFIWHPRLSSACKVHHKAHCLSEHESCIRTVTSPDIAEPVSLRNRGEPKKS